jgi:hypothetical protein
MVDDQTDGAFAPQQQQVQVQPRWCVVGNVVAQRLHGEHGEQRPGSKQFTGGTRVYYRSAYWGMGGESVTVLGIGRRPRRWITATIRSNLVENWRAAFIYTPRVLHELQADLPADENAARTLAGVMNRVSAESNWRLVARTAQECHQSAVAPDARILTGTTPRDDEQDQALILYRGTEAVAGLVYQAAPPIMDKPYAAMFRCSYLWMRPLAEPAEMSADRPPGRPADTVSHLFTMLKTRFPWHNLGALHAQIRRPLQT